MERRFVFRGSGGDLFLKFLIGALLSFVTFGIYLPWFLVDLAQWIYGHTTLTRPGAEDVTFEFTGRGVDLLGKLLLGGVLTMVTLGIYGPWFACDLHRWMAENSLGRTATGGRWGLRFNGTGGDLLGIVLLGVVLSMITLGIYFPWFVCKVAAWHAGNLDLLAGDRKLCAFAFDGQGGDLFVLLLVGILLTIVTFGIYAFWFQVKQNRFYLEHLSAEVEGARYAGGFTGTGGQLLVKTLIGWIVTSITLGLYAPWFLVDLVRWQLESTPIRGGAPRSGSLVDRPAPIG